MRVQMVRRGVAFAIACMAVLAANLPAIAADKPVNIVALGDSLTAGLGLPTQDAFPAKLQRALAAKGIVVTVRDAGVCNEEIEFRRADRQQERGERAEEREDFHSLTWAARYGFSSGLAGVAASVFFSHAIICSL